MTSEKGMSSRVELKQKAKERFSMHYGACVKVYIAYALAGTLLSRASTLIMTFTPVSMMS